MATNIWSALEEQVWLGAYDDLLSLMSFSETFSFDKERCNVSVTCEQEQVTIKQETGRNFRKKMATKTGFI